ncbi:hypothetical protein THIAE_09685 [Thiomicrospira aerophila AL3]|uniref:Uncharacterized protein n=1 Tax=Thiomicrospira aerophila AL3 TaxID=717772 RepID=W0DYQ2_9GAMM|nr:hypothetical protein [Thiomicrospira aerophila]AHF02398.1 hypothetical protein THIAE_09685 [Thiomicrospira aerophila AL3]
MTEFAVLIGLIFFPGLISAVISERITTHAKPWGVLKYGIYSFVLGLLSYTGLQMIDLIVQAFFIIPDEYEYLLVWNFILDSTSKFSMLEVFWATVFSVPLGFVVAAIINHKIINKLASFLHVSFKYGDENLFSYFLNARDADWVYVRDQSRNLTYEGRILSFSENQSIQELVLCDVIVYGYEDSQEYYSVPKIYLSKKVGEFLIEYVPKENFSKTKESGHE